MKKHENSSLFSLRQRQALSWMKCDGRLRLFWADEGDSLTDMLPSKKNLQYRTIRFRPLSHDRWKSAAKKHGVIWSCPRGKASLSSMCATSHGAPSAPIRAVTGALSRS